MSGRPVKFHFKGGGEVTVVDMGYIDLDIVKNSFDNGEAIHVKNVHIAPNEVLYYEEG
mgnify:CR=1 FL=1